MNGMAPSEVRDEMNANAARREELKGQARRLPRAAAAAASGDGPDLPHQGHRAAPERSGSRTAGSEATEALRGLVDAIVLTPHQDGETLQDRAEGESGGHVGSHRNKRRSRRNPTTSPCKYLLLRGLATSYTARALRRGGVTGQWWHSNANTPRRWIPDSGFPLVRRPPARCIEGCRRRERTLVAGEPARHRGRLMDFAKPAHRDPRTHVFHLALR